MRIAVFAAMLQVLGACQAMQERAGPSPGQALFMANCAVCHGETGRGDGPLAADLDLAPADLTQLSAKNGGAFPWEEVMAQIHGYPGRYDVMPDFGQDLPGPTVIWTDENGVPIETPKALLDLAKYLETIQG